MTSLLLLLGPIAALLGVLLGGLLTSRNQRQIWQREQQQAEREAVRNACSEYVSATRRFASYIKDINTTVTTVPGLAADEDPIHVVDDPSFHFDLERASAAVLLAVRTSETVERARDLRRALADLAVARAAHPQAALPSERLTVLRATEAAFINAARAELGAPALARGLYRLD
jgi:hypothetical protein